MYPNTYLKQLPAMGAHTGTAYSMSEGIGRSYRYYKGKPLYAFGTGLSLTTFNISCSPAASDDTTADAGTTATSADAGATAVPPPPFPIYRRVIVTCEVSADRLVSRVSWRLSRALGNNRRFPSMRKLETQNRPRVRTYMQVANTGSMVGDEVLMIFHEVGDEIRAAASKLHPVRTTIF